MSRCLLSLGLMLLTVAAVGWTVLLVIYKVQTFIDRRQDRR